MIARLGLPGLALLALSLSLVSAAPAGSPERHVVLTEGVDYYGADIGTLRDLSLAECQSACLAEPRCQAFTYNRKARRCFLKEGSAEPRPFDGAVSGSVISGAAAARNPASRRAEELNVVPLGYREEAAELARRLGAGAGFAKHTDANVAAALEALRDAPADSGRWQRAAEAALAVDTNDWDRQQRARIDATAAAINAYLHADSVRGRAAAMALIARALERRSAWRPAIRATRASLALADNPQLAAHLEELVSKYGFRVTGHEVDSDAQNPRICVEFSDPLAREGTEIADFFELDRDGLAVEPEASQVCIDGVRHGEKYHLTVRAGLAGSDGERLPQAVELDVYVRDRAPAVRFPGRAYVLPRGGAASLPVVTVNTDRVDATLWRIGDRALGGLAAEDGLFTNFSTYDVESLTERLAEKLWTGQIEVRGALNQDVTTAVPVDELLGQARSIGLSPGIYVLTARPWGIGSEDESLATQWFVVSDLGLAALSGGDGLHAIVRSLGSAAPVAGVRLKLLAVNQQVLGEAQSDDQGYARFAPGLLRGTGGNAPALLVAETDDDYGFLDLKGSPFDLSDRGVEGRPAPQALDVYLAAERGIYRPGETVFLTALLRDARANAVLDVPLTFIVRRPDGVEYLRDQVPDQGGGGRALAVPLLPSVMRGTWQVQVLADPTGEVLNQVPFLVEDFQPERLDFTLTPAAAWLDPADPTPVELAARFLYGAPAAGLPVEGRVRVTAADGLAAWPGVQFGLAEEPFEPVVEPLAARETDAAGEARLSLAVPELTPGSRPLQAEVSVSVLDGGGRPVERDLTLPVRDTRPRIGIRPLFEGAVQEGGNAGFEILALGADGAPLATAGLRWTLSKVETAYQWYQTDGDWDFEPVVNRSRVASGTLDLAPNAGNGLAADTPSGRIEAPVQWGGYLLEVSGPDGEALLPASLRFEAGWYVAPKAFDTPDVLKVSLDKAEYRVGDTAKIRLEPRFPGLALVMVLDDGIKTMQPVEVPAEGVTVDLPVTADWGPGAYVTAMLFRGMDVDAKRMPRRAIGLHWAGIDPGDRRLAVKLELPQQGTPRGPLPVTLDVDNLLAGGEAHVVIAAVDVGILNLTRFVPWAPDEWYFGQRRLGMALRDLYGRLIDRMQGEPGRLRSGAGGLSLQRADGPPPTEALVAFHSGVLRADDEGRVHVDFPLPDFNGTVKIMAMAWSVGGVGHASADLVVRDPVVVTPALPRFLAPGDRSRLLLDLAHVEGPAGTMQVRVTSADGGLVIDGAGEPIAVQLASGARRQISVGLAAEAIGDHGIHIELLTPDGKTLTKDLALGVRNLEPPVQLTEPLRLAPGDPPLVLDAATLTAPLDAAADGRLLAGLPALVPGTEQWLLSLSGAGEIDVPGLLANLDRFPLGCVEQTTSRALPLLYLDEMALVAGLGPDVQVPERIRDAISRVLGNQSSGGGFGLWGPGGPSDDLWLNAYVSDFLTRAREQGYAVPAVGLDLALDNLKNQLGYSSDFDEGGEGVAYALYVLARNGRVPLGDLRWFLETKLDAFATPAARAQLGGALALMGERERAEQAFASALALWQDEDDDGDWRGDFGSRLRDGAALLALAAEAGSTAVDLDALAGALGADGATWAATSTQEQSWLLLAARALMAGNAAPRLAIDGAAPVSGPLFRRLTVADLERGLTVANAGDRPLTALVTGAGVPAVPPPAGGNGYGIERAYYDLGGRRVDPAQVAQGTRLVVVLTVWSDAARAARLRIDDPLPAGLEIDNPHLLAAAAVSGLPWMNLVPSALAVEFRAERFVAAVDRDESDPRQFQLAYMARAVSPGRFAHPAASVEDMYRPQRWARGESGTMEISAPGRP